MKISYCLLILTLLSLSACATPNTILVNPNTGEYRNCAAAGWGWAGAPLAQMSHNSCVESLQSIGFVPTKDVTPSVLTIETDPSSAEIYAGTAKETLKSVGYSPFLIKHSPGSRLWNKECYQAKKAGFSDSKIECYDQVWGDRKIFFKLEKSGG